MAVQKVAKIGRIGKRKIKREREIKKEKKRERKRE